MTAIKQGDIAFVKTTGEEVFVLEVKEAKDFLPFDGFSGLMATCRVPVIGNEGCRHTTQHFLVEELETLEQRVTREYEAREAAQKTVSELRRDKTNGMAEALPVLVN